MNGLTDIKDLCFLQVKGQSQLAKEMDETRQIAHKFIDEDALHRNEITAEIEGVEGLQKKPPKINYDTYQVNEVIAKHMHSEELF